MTLLLNALQAIAVWTPGKLFWPYFLGIIVLVVGLAWLDRSALQQARRIDKILVFGPLFYAFPLAAFSGDHFVAAKFIATMVPHWIPFHLFWAYFVGVALFAAALSLVTGKQATLAAALTSAMLFSFVLLIHVPNFAKYPHNRILFAVLLRDASFAAGALAFSLAQRSKQGAAISMPLAFLVRCIIAIAVVIYGVEHFLYPEFVPVVPLEMPLPAYIPAHLFLSYVTGAVLIALGLALIVNWKPRLAATWLGFYAFAVVLLVYLPILVANIRDIDDGLNYFADTLMYSGVFLLLAEMLPAAQAARTSSKAREESAARAAASQSADA